MDCSVNKKTNKNYLSSYLHSRCNSCSSFLPSVCLKKSKEKVQSSISKKSVHSVFSKSSLLSKKQDSSAATLLTSLSSLSLSRENKSKPLGIEILKDNRINNENVNVNLLRSCNGRHGRLCQFDSELLLNCAAKKACKETGDPHKNNPEEANSLEKHQKKMSLANKMKIEKKKCENTKRLAKEITKAILHRRKSHPSKLFPVSKRFSLKINLKRNMNHLDLQKKIEDLKRRSIKKEKENRQKIELAQKKQEVLKLFHRKIPKNTERNTQQQKDKICSSRFDKEEKDVKFTQLTKNQISHKAEDQKKFKKIKSVDLLKSSSAKPNHINKFKARKKDYGYLSTPIKIQKAKKSIFSNSLSCPFNVTSTTRSCASLDNKTSSRKISTSSASLFSRKEIPKLSFSKVSSPLLFANRKLMRFSTNPLTSNLKNRLSKSSHLSCLSACSSNSNTPKKKWLSLQSLSYRCAPIEETYESYSKYLKENIKNINSKHIIECLSHLAYLYIQNILNFGIRDAPSKNNNNNKHVEENICKCENENTYSNVKNMFNKPAFNSCALINQDESVRSLLDKVADIFVLKCSGKCKCGNVLKKSFVKDYLFRENESDLDEYCGNCRSDSTEQSSKDEKIEENSNNFFAFFKNEHNVKNAILVDTTSKMNRCYDFRKEANSFFSLNQSISSFPTNSLLSQSMLSSTCLDSNLAEKQIVSVYQINSLLWIFSVLPCDKSTPFVDNMYEEFARRVDEFNEDEFITAFCLLVILGKKNLLKNELFLNKIYNEAKGYDFESIAIFMYLYFVLEKQQENNLKMHLLHLAEQKIRGIRKGKFLSVFVSVLMHLEITAYEKPSLFDNLLNEMTCCLKDIKIGQAVSSFLCGITVCRCPALKFFQQAAEYLITILHLFNTSDICVITLSYAIQHAIYTTPWESYIAEDSCFSFLKKKEIDIFFYLSLLKPTNNNNFDKLINSTNNELRNSCFSVTRNKTMQSILEEKPYFSQNTVSCFFKERKPSAVDSLSICNNSYNPMNHDAKNAALNGFENILFTNFVEDCRNKINELSNEEIAALRYAFKLLLIDYTPIHKKLLEEKRLLEESICNAEMCHILRVKESCCCSNKSSFAASSCKAENVYAQKNTIIGVLDDHNAREASVSTSVEMKKGQRGNVCKNHAESNFAKGVISEDHEVHKSSKEQTEDKVSYDPYTYEAEDASQNQIFIQIFNVIFSFLLSITSFFFRIILCFIFISFLWLLFLQLQN